MCPGFIHYLQTSDTQHQGSKDILGLKELKCKWFPRESWNNQSHQHYWRKECLKTHSYTRHPSDPQGWNSWSKAAVRKPPPSCPPHTHTTMMAILPPTSPTTVIGGFSLAIITKEEGKKRVQVTQAWVKPPQFYQTRGWTIKHLTLMQTQSALHDPDTHLSEKLI